MYAYVEITPNKFKVTNSFQNYLYMCKLCMRTINSVDVYLACIICTEKKTP